MTTPAPRRNWAHWLLLGSVGLNLVAAGFIGGAFMKGPPPPDPGPGPALWHFARSLPDPYRRDLGEALRATRKDWIGPREEMEGVSHKLAAALEADPYDPGAVQKLFQEQTDLATRLSLRGADLLMAQIERMTPADRAAYAEQLLVERGPKGPPPEP